MKTLTKNLIDLAIALLAMAPVFYLGYRFGLKLIELGY